MSEETETRTRRPPSRRPLTVTDAMILACYYERPYIRTFTWLAHVRGGLTTYCEMLQVLSPLPTSTTLAWTLNVLFELL